MSNWQAYKMLWRTAPVLMALTYLITVFSLGWCTVYSSMGSVICAGWLVFLTVSSNVQSIKGWRRFSYEPTVVSTLPPVRNL